MSKIQTATDKSQSDRLIACGVSPYTADMTLTHYPNGVYDLSATSFHYGCFDEHDAPAWSLSMLLALLPTSLTGPTGNEYLLELSKLRMHDAWEVQWFHAGERFGTYDSEKKFCKLWDESPIEACVKAVEWLTANGYKLNGQKHQADE